MSELKVNSIKGVNASTAAISIDNSSGTCTANITNKPNRNLIINGAMLVAQRGTTSTSEGYTCDRFYIQRAGVDESPTHAQVDVASGTTPYTNGFRKALKITNGNQTSGAAAGDYILARYKVEAQDMANSGWNYTSSSSYVTLSFWIKSSVAQNFYFSLKSVDGTAQNYAFETGSLSADTWTKVTKTIPGASNVQFNNDNGIGLQIDFWVFAGTNYTDSGVTLNQWAAFSSGNRMPDHTSTWYTTNDATLEITGVQLEVGSVATDFEHKLLDQDYDACLRYAYVINVTNTDAIDRSYAYAYSTTILRGLFYLPKAMRTYPSYTGTATDVNFYASNNSAYFHLDDIVNYIGSNLSPFPNTFAFGLTTSSITGGHAGILLGREDDGKIIFDAEL